MIASEDHLNIGKFISSLIMADNCTCADNCNCIFSTKKTPINIQAHFNLKKFVEMSKIINNSHTSIPIAC